MPQMRRSDASAQFLCAMIFGLQMAADMAKEERGMSESMTVLMYHAVTEPADRSVGGADPHYSVSRSQFLSQLDQIQAAGLTATSLAALLDSNRGNDRVGMTFDDGHVSNGAAAQWLADRSFSADFFVNPGLVGTRGFLSWFELKQMADAGMSIQSHGFHHRYMSELSPREVANELESSKRAIEDKLGVLVTLFAPPGGRVGAGLAATAALAGYTALCTSRPALWHVQDGSWDIPRLAVLSSTTESRFANWIAQDLREMARQRGRHLVLATAKRLLGNSRYERVRRALLPSMDR